MSPTDSLNWSDVAAGDLDVPTLYDVLALRSAVFVVEQQCPYQDPDGLDLLEGTRHLIGRGTVLAAYARILAPESVVERSVETSGQSRPVRPTPRIGRVIVTSETRGQQLGRRLMERALACCEEHWPGQPVELGAQAHLAEFYSGLGFAPVGDPYDEDGILHLWMHRPAG